MKHWPWLILTLCLGSCTLFTQSPPERPIICFTFDDQHHNVYELAEPALSEYGWRATCFVNSSALGASGLLSLEQLQDLHQNMNWEVGGHTLNHEDLAGLNYSEAATAIGQDYQNLVNWGFDPQSFALPKGVCPVDYYPLIRAHYNYIRGSSDLAMHVPLNTDVLGYLPFQSGWTAQIIKDRIIRGMMNDESLIIIGFHRIEDNSSSYNANCPLEEFKEILAFVKQHDLEVLPLAEAVDKLN